MSRPLQIEFPGAVYHVTARGDRREPIYRDDVDRTTQLHVIAQAMQRFDAQVLAYCQMGNHFQKAQRKSPSMLQDCLQRTADRPEALRMAYRECGITMTAMAKELRLSVSRISRAIAAAEAVEGGLEARGKT